MNESPQNICKLGLPVGAILRNLEETLRSALPRVLPKTLTKEIVTHVNNVYREFDATYHIRDDYKLWRSAALPLPSHDLMRFAGWRTDLSITWGDWRSVARAAVETDDSITFWSVVALASDLIKTARAPKSKINRADAGDIMGRLRERLRSGPERISWCPASCDIAAVLFLMQYQFHHLPSKREFGWRDIQKYHRQYSTEDIEKWLHEIEGYLRRIDPGWRPAKRINTWRLERERKRRPVLRAGFAIDELAALTETLREISPFITENEEELNDGARALRNKGCDYAYTAWLTARAWRLRETRYQERATTSDQSHASWEKNRNFKIRERAFIKERDCILNLAVALRDAERYLEAAVFNYRFMRLTPDEFANASYIEKTLNNRGVIFQQLKEAGFEVDPRFLAVEKIAEQRDLAGEQGPTKKHEKGFFRVVERDQKKLATWKPVLEEFPQEIDKGERLKAYVRRVIRLMAENQPASRQALEAGYELALRYGYIRSAAKILERAVEHDAFELKSPHMARLVERMVECTSYDPFALDYKTLGEWHQLIRNSCSKLYRNRTKSDWLSGHERARMHEALLGTTHTHHRALSRQAASALFGKAIGIFSIDRLREFYDRQHDFLVKPPAPASPEEIAAFCRRNNSSHLGEAAYVSVLCMSGLASVVGIAGDGRVQYEDVTIGEIKEQIPRFREKSRFWFRFGGMGLQRQITWPQDLEKIGCAVLRIAQRCSPNSRVIILAVEPQLAALPWQHLISVSAAKLELERSANRAVTQYLVAIVPNGRAVMLDGSEFKPGIECIISTETDSAIIDVSESVRRTTTNGTELNVSACIIVGHGKQSDGGALPVINLGHRQLDTIEEWIKIIRARHIILHCCHSGAINTLFMQELGGLPGIALSLGSTMLLAPVTDVDERTAIALQESMFENVNVPVGKAYLTAISNDPSVCRYNLFGNPYDKLTFGALHNWQTQ